jgi:hypothetical protein
MYGLHIGSIWFMDVYVNLRFEYLILWGLCFQGRFWETWAR